MKLQEIFDQLTTGELSQISIGGQDAGVINENNHGKLVGLINLGLTALYKRFNLKERRITVPLQEDSETYELRIEDILKIEKVETDLGVAFALNQDGDAYSLFTPTMNTLRVPQVILEQGVDLPDELRTLNMLVTYRANHPKLTAAYGALIPETKTIELPSSHLQALLYFVASRAHNPVGMTNEFGAGTAWYSRYEEECQRLMVENLHVDKVTVVDRIARGGWA